MPEEKWKGTYTLGKSYGLPLTGKTVEFVMNLTIKDGQIKGTCQDLGEIEEAFDKPASIEGSLTNGKIVFTKRYPGRLEADEKNYYAYSDVPSADIIYKGVLKTKLFSRQKYFKGKWSIETLYRIENNKEIIIKTEGVWKMQKE